MRQYFGRGTNVHDCGMWPLFQQLWQPGARAIYKHPPPRLNSLQFGLTNPVSQAIGGPVHRKRLCQAQALERVIIYRLVALSTFLNCTGDGTASPVRGQSVRPRHSQTVQHTVLARARRSDDVNETLIHC